MVGAVAISVTNVVGHCCIACISAFAKLQATATIKSEEAGVAVEPQIVETGESGDDGNILMEGAGESGVAGVQQMEKSSAAAGAVAANRPRVGMGHPRKHPIRGKGRPKKRGFYHKKRRR